MTERILATPRLFLEPLMPSHAQAMFPQLQEPRLYEFIPQEPPPSLEALTERYERLARRESPSGGETWLNWAMRIKGAEAFVGLIETTVRPDSSAQLAYYVFPSQWRRGYAKEGCRRVLKLLFDDFKMKTVSAVLDTRNAASAGLLESMAFQRTAHTPNAATVKGAPSDEYRYELQRERWELAMHPKTAEV
ncbi:MAG: GNAT family N-acetyltransferase [Proteobacteria bacterium]|nr:GNAT family N-acetyltransferase [Pseudomonadota bacterium]